MYARIKTSSKFFDNLLNPTHRTARPRFRCARSLTPDARLLTPGCVHSGPFGSDRMLPQIPEKNHPKPILSTRMRYLEFVTQFGSPQSQRLENFARCEGATGRRHDITSPGTADSPNINRNNTVSAKYIAQWKNPLSGSRSSET